MSEKRSAGSIQLRRGAVDREGYKQVFRGAFLRSADAWRGDYLLLTRTIILL